MKGQSPDLKHHLPLENGERKGNLHEPDARGSAQHWRPPRASKGWLLWEGPHAEIEPGHTSQRNIGPD